MKHVPSIKFSIYHSAPTVRNAVLNDNGFLYIADLKLSLIHVFAILDRLGCIQQSFCPKRQFDYLWPMKLKRITSIINTHFNETPISYHDCCFCAQRIWMKNADEVLLFNTQFILKCQLWEKCSHGNVASYSSIKEHGKLEFIQFLIEL